MRLSVCALIIALHGCSEATSVPPDAKIEEACADCGAGGPSGDAPASDDPSNPSYDPGLNPPPPVAAIDAAEARKTALMKCVRARTHNNPVVTEEDFQTRYPACVEAVYGVPRRP